MAINKLFACKKKKGRLAVKLGVYYDAPRVIFHLVGSLDPEVPEV